MRSATEHPKPIDDYVRKEKEYGSDPPKIQPGKWRIITDLSFPEGFSINDATSPNLCSLSYVTVDTVAAEEVALGKSSKMAKIDIKLAYRLVPVKPLDRVRLGMQWQEEVCVDGMLPFGLRLAPKLFNVVADGIKWCVGQRGVQYIFHYLDDIIVLGPLASPKCENLLLILKQTCADFGVPLAPEKQDGPTPVIKNYGFPLKKCRGYGRPYKELALILVAAVLWGHNWRGGRVWAQCDNAAVVSVLNSRYCKDKKLMQMLRVSFS